MKKILITALAFLAFSSANAAELAKYQPGNRLIDGSQLNKMVAVVNGLTGNGGTVSGGYFSANTTGTTGPTPLTSTVLQVVGANSATARIEIDAFAGPAIFTARRMNGTKAAVTPLLSADQLGSFNFNGASTTLLTYGPAGRVTSFATENWSSTAGGTKVVISTTPNTTQTLTDTATFDQDGSLLVTGGVTSSGSIGKGVGYSTGAGGAVTQATNRITGVTLSKLAGQITTNNASLAAETAAAFVVTNTAVAIGDVPVLAIQSGSNGGNTTVSVTTVTNGSFTITVANQNASGGAAETGAIIINYAVVKSVAN